MVSNQNSHRGGWSKRWRPNCWPEKNVPSRPVNRTRHSPGRSSFRFTRWLHRIIDGERVWGSVEAWPGRHGLKRYRLVVFPPGITATERRRLRLSRARPLWIPVVYLGLLAQGDSVANDRGVDDRSSGRRCIVRRAGGSPPVAGSHVVLSAAGPAILTGMRSTPISRCRFGLW